MAIENTPPQKTSKAAAASPPAAAERGPSFSLGQRFTIGVNVTVMVIAAVALVILTNVIANTRFYRGDWSSMGRYSVSDLTRTVVRSIDKPIRITLLYNSQDPEKARDIYQPRVYELVQDIRLIGRDVTVEDIGTPANRGQFAQRLQKKMGSSLGDYGKLVLEFKEKHPALKGQLQQEQARLAELVNDPKAWARPFGQVQRTYGLIAAMIEELDKTFEEVSEQEQGGGLMVAHDRQIDAIRKLVDACSEALKTVQKDMADLSDLAGKMTAGDGGAAGRTAELSGQVEKEFAALSAKLPGGGAATQPADGAGLFRQSAASFRRIAQLLNEQAKLLKAFADDQPAVRGLPGWRCSVQMGMLTARVPLDEFFAAVAGRLQNGAAEQEAVAGQLTAEAIRRYLPALVEGVAEERDQVRALYENTRRVFDALGKVDERSQKLLDAGKNYLADLGKTLEDLKSRLGKLPELKGGGLADKLKEDNVVVIEVGDGEPRVVGFNDIWPEVAGLDPIPGQVDKKRQTRRTFNGDASLGAALFAAGQPPLAEVVLVHYPSTPGPMMYRQPDEGDLPLSQLSTLRERLERANLKVTEWNLASSREPPLPAYPDSDDKSKPESATTQPATGPERTPLPRVYVVLPPPPGPGPMAGEEQGGFNPDHARAVGDAIKDGGQAIFLACFSMPRQAGFWGEPVSPPYAWNGYLSEEWGITIRNDHRLVQGIPDREEGKFRLSPERFYWMTTNHFNEASPVGKPLVARRVLLTDVCPIERPADADRTSRRPPGVTYTTLLDVPLGNRTIWATRDIRRAINELYTSNKVSVSAEDMRPPLEVMVEAVREPTEEGQKEKSRIIVFSGGRSLTDYYLPQRVPRGSEEEGLMFDAPPEANAEILVNSVYHLAGLDKWIAAGPVVVPPIRISQGKLMFVQQMVIWGWPLIVLIVGGVAALWRRSH